MILTIRLTFLKYVLFPDNIKCNCDTIYPTFQNFCLFAGTELEESTLQLVEIYFDTATFDDIEKDKKIKTEAQLSLIGGTMGLLSGFSIISGIEIVFFLFRSI